MYICMYIYICVCVRVCACVYVFVHIHIHACVCVYVVREARHHPIGCTPPPPSIAGRIRDSGLNFRAKKQVYHS